MITYTGVFATEEERKELQEMAGRAASTPVITLSSDMPSFAEVAWKDVAQRCHAVALSHGLPEILGYYGLDLKGEFVYDD
jgi:GTP:adenosylcobinamide-phosphate guanylyltransferase